MSKYVQAYEMNTGKKAPILASNLDELFSKIENDSELPPRGQQAVDAGFTAHTLSDSSENPAIFKYYRWIISNMLDDHPVKELSARLIGTSFTSANVFQTDLPQPVTLNQWQMERIQSIKLMTDKAIILENNGVFIFLHKLHPNWPLINQSGNDFNSANNQIMLELKKENLRMSYLGDIDSSGIQILDHLVNLLDGPDSLLEIQTPEQVLDWLVRFGKKNIQRTKEIQVNNPTLVKEMSSIHTLSKFVEQEQLIDDYETLIEKWLSKK
mgnify:CR=1 FL=1